MATNPCRESPPPGFSARHASGDSIDRRPQRPARRPHANLDVTHQMSQFYRFPFALLQPTTTSFSLRSGFDIVTCAGLSLASLVSVLRRLLDPEQTATMKVIAATSTSLPCRSMWHFRSGASMDSQAGEHPKAIYKPPHGAGRPWGCTLLWARRSELTSNDGLG